VLLQIDGKRVKSTEPLRKLAADLPAGKPIPVLVRRGRVLCVPRAAHAREPAREIASIVCVPETPEPEARTLFFRRPNRFGVASLAPGEVYAIDAFGDHPPPTFRGHASGRLPPPRSLRGHPSWDRRGVGSHEGSAEGQG